MSALTDPISDMLTRLRNSCAAGKADLIMPYSKMKSEIARILKEEGYVDSYELDTTGKHPRLKVRCKFVAKTPVIAGLKRISRPGLRRYVGATEMPRVLGGMGIAIISTSRGLLTGHNAKKQKVGGELLAYVW
ncbi:MAG: 30S ribosomal protein S8 [Chthoniobacterales bacterium]